jgi:hypothetical protein
VSRPRWFPPLRPNTPEEDVDAILQCQGMWWLWGGSICKQPEACVAAMECYFVVQAAAHKFDVIHWMPGFDPEPVTLELWGAA